MTDRLLPCPLSQGSSVRVFAPAGPVDPDLFREGLRLLADRFNVICPDAVLARDGFLAGDDALRGRLLQEAVDDPTADALIAARGGWGTSRIIDGVDTSGLVERPRPVVGSSDLTTLLMELWTRHRLVTIHGPMVERFSENHPPDLEALFDLLEGAPPRGADGLLPISGGGCAGPLIGGNLTVLAHLCGRLDPSVTDGAILFLEDVGEPPYRLDRVVTQLARAGILSGVAGIVLGGFTGCRPNQDGRTALDVMRSNLLPLGVPIAAGYPGAHGERNLPFLHGAATEMVVTGEDVSLVQEPLR